MVKKNERNHKLQLGSEKKALCCPWQSQHFSTKPKTTKNQKKKTFTTALSIKSTQFSYQHHFMTVINKKAHGYLLTIEKKETYMHR